jgi:Tol biopolymer transport system component
MPANHRSAAPAATLLALLAASATAPAQSTVRASVDAAGGESNQWSGCTWIGESPAFSADDRWIAFESLASNLVAGDTNGSIDIFVKDLATGGIVRVSVDSAGVQGDRDSSYPSLSADGRFVAFVSMSDNLVAGDTNNTQDVFLHDRDPDGNGIFDEGNGVTTRVSVRSNGAQANSASGFPMVSADGSTVVYYSYATNLVGMDTNGAADVFAYDRLTGKTTRMSVDSAGVQANDASYYSAVSADGQLVAFSSHAGNLVAGDSNGALDVFVRDRTAGTTTRVSVDSTGVEGNAGGDVPAISADGNVVSFMSTATNLVAGDTNAVADVFVHDRTSAATERVSVDSAGTEANGESDSIVLGLSADGRFVAFTSLASNLVAGDANLTADVFVRDRKTATTTRASVDSSGSEGDDASGSPGISADGELVAFVSSADDLVANDLNGQNDVFVRNRCVAIASSYGAGWPGTLGTPTLVAGGDPVLGASLTVTISNSLGVNTPGLVLIGLAEASVVTGKGGTLLVAPLLFVPLLIHAAGEGLSGTLPSDPALCGVAVDLQALELDAGASKGMSFTAGLKLLLGF